LATITKSDARGSPDVEEGRYVLVIDSKDYLFPSYSLSVLASGGVLVKSHEVHRIPAENAPLLPHPLSITPLSKAEYVEPIKPFNLQGLVLGNPLILLMVGGGLLMFLMPKVGPASILAATTLSPTISS
jgi:hypothetical protein